MTDEQKKYIEDHIKLIEKNKWDKFFKNAPRGTGGILHEAGIDFISEVHAVYAFMFDNCAYLTNIAMSNNITSIGIEAFANCSNLTYITIPDSVVHMDAFAFKNCSKLKTVNIGNSLTTISSFCFQDCTELNNVTIGTNVTTIDSYAFYNCSNLHSINLPKNVNSIKDGAFYCCSSLSDIIINNDSIDIDKHVFADTYDPLNITFNGTVNRWKQMINSGTFYKVNYICNCIDGTVKKLR